MCIGPRPNPQFVHSQNMESLPPCYRYRLLAKPGITGWAVVNAPTHPFSLDIARQGLEYDLYWISNRGILLDLEVLRRTVGAVLTGFGSL